MSDKEKPFGDYSILTPGNLDWLAGLNESFGKSRDLKAVQQEIGELNITFEDLGDNAFFLSNGDVGFEVRQIEDRISIAFLPRKDLSLKPQDLYKLFFEELPRAVYADLGFGCPLPDLIKNSTVVTIKTSPFKEKTKQLWNPTDKEFVDDYLRDRRNTLISVKMSIEAQDIVPFSISMPNPNQDREKDDVKYSFALRDALTPQTMGILLGFQKNGANLNGEEDAYAQAYARGINLLREALRIK